MSDKHVVGIDLGTSNSAIALGVVGSDKIETIQIVQVHSPGTIESRSLLPSAIYIPHPDEAQGREFQLPWQTQSPNLVVGNYAKDRGSQLPDRVITSAKSWLCNSSLDRKAPVLPWRSESVEQKLSAFESSRIFLEHLKASFNHECFLRSNNLSTDNASTVITVPASFDEAARALTYEAAHKAGFNSITLLEEPQAAFYAWISHQGDAWREQVDIGDLVLVCDLGGGTADFSLLVVSEENKELRLDRISVGEHVLLGGDNMDLALAFSLRGQIEENGDAIDDWQFLSLIQSARMAKERLLSDDSLDKITVSVPSRGSSLFAGTISVEVHKGMVEAIVINGFMPLTEISELPAQRSSLGLQEYGLPYASDPALSKHLARFLMRSMLNVRSNSSLADLLGQRVDVEKDQYLLPNKVLFNGGVFKASGCRARVIEILRNWSKVDSVEELLGADLDLAVSKGAAYYGRCRLSGDGIRIKSGIARSYYIGLESSMPAVPGYTPPVKGLCVAEQGMEEGSELVLDNREFGLLTGAPVTFRFFSSDIRAGDKIGSIVGNAERDLEETSRLEMSLPPIEGSDGAPIPVKLHAMITELGMLELWMQHTQSDNRWKLEFNVRAQT